MKLKYYLRGLGIGIIMTTIILMISFSRKKLSDEEVIKRAEELGMVMKEEEPLFSSESQLKEQIETEAEETETEETETEETEQTESAEQTTDTEHANDSENEGEKENVSDNEIQQNGFYHLIIPAGTVPRIICNELEENGVVDSASQFRQYLVDVGYATSIVAGEYDIPYGATYEEIYQILKAGPN